MPKLAIFRIALLSLSVSLFCAPIRSQELPAQTDGGSPPVSTSDTLEHVGRGVSRPVLLHYKDPKYSKEARKGKISGDVEISLHVEKDGSASHIHVVKSLGYGLDEKAMEAVRTYRFKPALKDGSPVVVDLLVNVNFQIF
jgi:TonB family protein